MVGPGSMSTTLRETNNEASSERTLNVATVRDAQNVTVTGGKFMTGIVQGTNSGTLGTSGEDPTVGPQYLTTVGSTGVADFSHAVVVQSPQIVQVFTGSRDGNPPAAVIAHPDRDSSVVPPDISIRSTSESARSPFATAPGNTPNQVDPPVRGDHDIYYDQLLGKARGSPMWSPGPSLNLPKEYRRKGIGIGDVGILYKCEGFSFLFNIYLPADHPINIGRVPPGFEPLDDPELQYEMTEQPEFGRDYYLASSSVQKLYSADPSCLIFESTAAEGAIIVMPKGAITQDMMSRTNIKKYLVKNAENWYKFVTEVRKREVENGDIRLVTGFDKVPTWGIATFANSGDQQVRLEFRKTGVVSKSYQWNCVGSGCGKVGPRKKGVKDLSQVARKSVPNQCIFLRTLNFNLSGETWDDLKVRQIPFNNPSSGSMPPSNHGDINMGGHQPSSGTGHSGGQSSSGHGHGQSSSGYGITFHAAQFGLSVVHPANYINRCLLEKHPKARIAITEDEDWMSVITKQDTKFPGLDVICSRVLTTRARYEENGVVAFKTQDLSGLKSSTQRPRLAVQSNERKKIDPFDVLSFKGHPWRKVFGLFVKKVEFEDLSEDDTIIILMGPTGSGKSSFIEKITGIESAVHHGLNPQLAKFSVTTLSIPEFIDSDIHFVETPGFDSGDGTNESEAATFDMISEWLNKTYKKRLHVAGLLYFHRITDNRFGSSALRNLGSFQRLCGAELKRIVLTTTMWDRVDKWSGVQREEELRSGSWKPMINRGSFIKRFHHTQSSAFDVLAPIFEQINRRRAGLLAETLDNLGVKLKQSSSGEKLFKELEELSNLQQERLAKIRVEQQSPSLPQAEYDQLMWEYEKACLDLQVLLKKAEKVEPNTRRLLQARGQFFQNVFHNEKSAQPNKNKATPFPGHNPNLEHRPILSIEDVRAKLGSMKERPLQSRVDHMQSSSTPVANFYLGRPTEEWSSPQVQRSQGSRPYSLPQTYINQQAAGHTSSKPSLMLESSPSQSRSSKQTEGLVSNQVMMGSSQMESHYRTQYMGDPSTQAAMPARPTLDEFGRPRKSPSNWTRGPA